MPVLNVASLSVCYKPGKVAKNGLGNTYAVDGVSFFIEKGKCLGIVGESGAGKSTVAQVVIGLVNPTSGSVLINGEKVCGPGTSGAQMIFQNVYGSLNPKRRVCDTILEPCRGKGRKTETASVDEMRLVYELLDIMELDRSFAYRYPSSLSGGERQRVAIARALAAKPQIIIADEPTSALDAAVRQKINIHLKKIKDMFGLTMLVISHDFRTVQFLCDETAVMEKGRFVEWGETEDVCHKPAHPYTKRLLASIPQLNSVKRAECRAKLAAAIAETDTDWDRYYDTNGRPFDLMPISGGNRHMAAKLAASADSFQYKEATTICRF